MPTPRCSTNHRRLGDILIQHKLIDKSQLDQALDIQRQRRRPRFLGEILVELRAVSPEHLQREVRRFGRIGEVLLRREKISHQQLELALNIQKHADRHRFLGDILIELGFVTDDGLELASDELAEDLVRSGVISENQLKLSRDEQSRSKRMPPLGAILIELGFINESQLLGVFSRYCQIPFLRIGRQKVDSSVRDIIPTYIIRRRKVIPLSKMGRLLTLAMVNPFDNDTIDMLEELLNVRISPIVCTDQDFQTALAKYYRGPITTTIPLPREEDETPRLGPGRHRRR
jgi:hypothetical protein